MWVTLLSAHNINVRPTCRTLPIAPTPSATEGCIRAVRSSGVSDLPSQAHQKFPRGSALHCLRPRRSSKQKIPINYQFLCSPWLGADAGIASHRPSQSRISHGRQVPNQTFFFKTDYRKILCSRRCKHPLTISIRAGRKGRPLYIVARLRRWLAC